MIKPSLILISSKHLTFPLCQKGGALAPSDSWGILFTSYRLLKTHPSGYHIYRVAHATFGHPLAAFRQLNLALSIPLSSWQKSMDSANFRDSSRMPTHTLQPCPGAASHTTRTSPRAEGARRVLNGSKLRSAP